MIDLARIGDDWIEAEVGGLTDHIDRVLPSVYNERTRYVPASVSPRFPGYIRYGLTPYIREILDCFDVDSPVREVNLKKGVQIAYTTLLESILLYAQGHLRTVPVMLTSADKELVFQRIENNILPMLEQSGMAHIIRSSDEGNSRKTGKTKQFLQWEGGGYMIPAGAKNADKMRSYTILYNLQDEIDAWPERVGRDGDPGKLIDDRSAAVYEHRKIARGGTPLILQSSRIQKQWLRGDQRIYRVLCKSCNFPQSLRWSTPDGVGGFFWETDGGMLVSDSVHYRCAACGCKHYEHEKTRLFSEEAGAHWHPTARPVSPDIRSYHLPAMYSPVGMQPWYRCVLSYLDAFDPVEKKVTDIGAYQVFYNNILGEPFEVLGDKIQFVQVSGHRRTWYKYGDIPNTYATQYSGSPILLLTCQVDVHKSFLAVTVLGWCRDAKPYLIDYHKLEGDDCTAGDSPVWGQLQEIIEEREYTADDGTTYRIGLTFIDAGYANDTVVTFCSQYGSGVFPTLGRDRPGKNQRIREFSEFTTPLGTVGYLIIVDHYKDRIAPVLRREWTPDAGLQKPYHFNAPYDASDAQLKELTRETRRQKTDANGSVTHYWHRAGRNELWDNLIQGYAGIEILAWNICIQHFELDTIDWPRFWDYLAEGVYFTPGP